MEILILDESFNRFSKDYSQFVNHDEPDYAVVDSFATTLDHNPHRYITVPPSKSKTGTTLYMMFDVKKYWDDKDYYVYKGIKITPN